MNIFRCEMCQKPCTITTLDEKAPVFCPVTRGAAEWRRVNGRRTGTPALVSVMEEIHS